MKSISFIFFVAIFSITGCDKPDNENGIPNCGEEMIIYFNNNEACETSANVGEEFSNATFIKTIWEN